MDDVSSKLLGSGFAGILESVIFHPADTISKRLMSNQQKLVVYGKQSNLKEILLHTKTKPTLNLQIKGLYNGLGFSLIHRFTQRMYGYGGQPILREFVEGKIDIKTRTERIGSEWACGALVGLGETVFMPFDLLKVKKQTNSETFGNRSMITIFREERINNYFKGINITAARNFVAMGNFFMINSIVREFIFDKQDPWGLSFFQYAFSASLASLCSITSSSPFDVIKTRVQNKDFGERSNSFVVVKDILQKEGPRAFYKGLATKLVTIGPKIVFTYASSQYFISYLQNLRKIDSNKEDCF